MQSEAGTQRTGCSWTERGETWSWSSEQFGPVGQERRRLAQRTRAWTAGEVLGKQGEVEAGKKVDRKEFFQVKVKYEPSMLLSGMVVYTCIYA